MALGGESIQRYYVRRGVGLALLCALLPGTAKATVIRFEFTVGGEPFGAANIRLFDTAMPRSVNNFAGYFNRYEGTFIHRNPRNAIGGPDGNFVVQGGGFAFVPPASAPQIPLDPPILDEPGGGVQGISNLRGTIANAKSGPDTVTSQWFVNLGDNSFLDSPQRPDGGFAAFGRVLGDGMEVFDAIDLLQKRDLDPFPNQDLFNDVPVGNVNDPLSTLVILESASILALPAGDYNFDGIVNLADFGVWNDSFGSTTLLEADGNGNGIVDDADYEIWRSSLNWTASSKGDYNGDGLVDASDYGVWRDSLGSVTNLAADGDGSQMVDYGDLAIWRYNAGRSQLATASTGLESSPVAEPGSSWLAVGLGFGFGLLRWQKKAGLE